MFIWRIKNVAWHLCFVDFLILYVTVRPKHKVRHLARDSAILAVFMTLRGHKLQKVKTVSGLMKVSLLGNFILALEQGHMCQLANSHW